MEREWIGARTFVALLGTLLVAAGCGSSVTVEEGVGGGSQAIELCVENADCNDDSVCFDGVCRFVGQCTMDVHCTCAAPVCTENACVGESACGGGTFVLNGGEDSDPPPPPKPCEINADCGAKRYCVDGTCHLTLECLKHAHCQPKEGCFQHLCWPL